MRADLYLGPVCRAVRCERLFRHRGNRRIPDRPHGTAFFLPAAADLYSGTASTGTSDCMYTAKPERTAEFHRSGGERQRAEAADGGLYFPLSGAILRERGLI